MKEDEIETRGIEIRNKVHREKLILSEVFRKEAETMRNKPDILRLALGVAPNRSLGEAIVIIYHAFKMKPHELESQIKEYMSGGRWDRLSYAQLTIAEDLLGLKRDSLYSIFRND